MPTSIWTAPNALWTLSFLVESNPTVADSWATGFNPPYSTFQYTLNDSSVTAVPEAIAFSTNQTLAVTFASGTGFQLFGPPAFFGPTSAPTILPGSYTATAQPATVSPYFEIDSNFIQDLTGTVVTISPVPVGVPESPTWVLMVVAILALWFSRRKLAHGAVLSHFGRPPSLLRDSVLTPLSTCSAYARTPQRASLDVAHEPRDFTDICLCRSGAAEDQEAAEEYGQAPEDTEWSSRHRNPDRMLARKESRYYRCGFK